MIYACLGCGGEFHSADQRDEHEQGCWKGKDGDKPEVKP